MSRNAKDDGGGETQMLFRARLTGGLLLLAILAALPWSSGCQNASPAVVCRITDVSGEARIHRQGATVLDAAKGADLLAGDKLVTGTKSSAMLQFADFATLALGEKSEFVARARVVDGKGVVQTSTELLKGMGLIKVVKGKGKGFQVKTPHVITGVLGTEYGIEVDENTEVAVMSGLVSCEGGGGSVEIPAGQGARCNGTTPPGLLKKYFAMESRLGTAMKAFLEGDGSKQLNTIFRYY